MMDFARPELLWLLTAIPILLFLKGKHGRTAALAVSSVAPAAALRRRNRGRAGRWLNSLRALALASLVIGCARPRLGDEHVQVSASGIDIMLAVDVSGSMEALDFELDGERANRLQAVKRVLRGFIEKRPGDRFGLIAFAGRPYLVAPLTLDHEWLLERLDALETGMGENGTAIGSAIASAANRLSETDARSKITVLLTDGMNNSGDVSPAAAAEASAALGIKVYTIGAGTRGEAPIPVKDPFGRVELRLAKVDIDEKTLKEVAEKTKARYFRATDTASLESIYGEIDSLEKTRREMKRFVNHRELFPWAVLAALGLLGAELLVGNTIFRRLP